MPFSFAQERICPLFGVRQNKARVALSLLGPIFSQAAPQNPKNRVNTCKIAAGKFLQRIQY
jgi:hypothetical protein